MSAETSKPETEDKTPESFLMMFAPERWSAAQRFAYFIGPPFNSTRRLVQACRAAERRRQKLGILVDVANILRPGLALDEQELERSGYSDAMGSRRYAAIAETILLELYSCLDVIRTAIFEIYQGTRGVQKNSTEKLLKRAHEGSYGPEFPEPIREALAAAFASWYPELRRIRTEVSHGDIGSCHIDESTGCIVYSHINLGSMKRAMVIDDIEAKITELSRNVTELVDAVFLFLCSQLGPTEVTTPCGVFRGYLYERKVSYGDDLSFDSGRCFSKTWFEEEREKLCPLRNRCGAYAR